MKFECTQCGNCCRHSGDLRFTKTDWDNLLSYLNKSEDEIKQIYEVQSIDDKLFFIWGKDVCPFLLDNNHCAIQEVKPLFCKLYIPFLDDEDSLIYQMCEGLGKGKDYTEEEINSIKEILFNELVIVKEN